MTRSRSDNIEACNKVNDADKLAKDSMKRQLSMWRKATLAMQNKIPITDPFAPNITVGRLAADIETIVPRDVQSLLGNRPYLPYGAVDKNNPDAVMWAAGITDNVDYYSTRGENEGTLYIPFSDMMRQFQNQARDSFWLLACLRS